MITAAEVKTMLAEFVDDEREIDNQIERLESLETKMYGIGAQQITDMPRNPSPSDDRMSVLVQRKLELEEKIKRMIHKQEEKRKRYESIMEQISVSDQRAVIRMRYLDAEKWDDVSRMIFGNDEDFEEKRDSYMRRIMILHGNALQQMAAIMNSEK